MAPPSALAPKRPPREVTRLSTLIGDLMGHVHRRSAGDTLAILNEAGLTMAQFVALHMLVHRGGCSVSAVAAGLRLSPAATSHLVDRLVVSGFVERSEDPNDRRAKRLVITSSGRNLVGQVQEERTREFSQVLARLSPEVRRSFSDVLERVLGELDTAS